MRSKPVQNETQLLSFENEKPRMYEKVRAAFARNSRTRIVGKRKEEKATQTFNWKTSNRLKPNRVEGITKNKIGGRETVKTFCQTLNNGWQIPFFSPQKSKRTYTHT